MTLSEQEKSQIRSLLTTPQWKTIERVAETIISEIKEDSYLRATEFDTIVSVVKSEGKREGIRDFLKRLYNEAGQ